MLRVCVALFAEAEELGSREIEIESKTFIIEVKSNDQGRFVKILEVWRERGRGGQLSPSLCSKRSYISVSADADAGTRSHYLLR